MIAGDERGLAAEVLEVFASFDRILATDGDIRSERHQYQLHIASRDLRYRAEGTHIPRVLPRNYLEAWPCGFYR